MATEECESAPTARGYDSGGRADLPVPGGVLSVRGRCGPREEEAAGLLLLTQVHGADVLADPASGERGDGIVVPRDGPTPALRVADCLPLFLLSGTHVAAVHAGWRGLAAGVVENALSALPDAPLAVLLGPRACGRCYEVGEEVRRAVLDGLPEDEQPSGRLDIAAAALARLRRAGLPGEEACRVLDAGPCTVCRSDILHSYRADGGSGRNLVWYRASGRRLAPGTGPGDIRARTLEAPPTRGAVRAGQARESRDRKAGPLCAACSPGRGSAGSGEDPK